MLLPRGFVAHLPDGKAAKPLRARLGRGEKPLVSRPEEGP